MWYKNSNRAHEVTESSVCLPPRKGSAEWWQTSPLESIPRGFSPRTWAVCVGHYLSPEKSSHAPLPLLRKSLDWASQKRKGGNLVVPSATCAHFTLKRHSQATLGNCQEKLPACTAVFSWDTPFKINKKRIHVITQIKLKSRHSVSFSLQDYVGWFILFKNVDLLS